MTMATGPFTSRWIRLAPLVASVALFASACGSSAPASTGTSQSASAPAASAPANSSPSAAPSTSSAPSSAAPATSAPPTSKAPAPASKAPAPKNLGTVHIAYVQKSASLLALFVAQDAGYFTQNGVHVVLDYIPGGVQTIKAVLAGSDQMGTFGDIEILNADAHGGNIVNVASMVNRPFFWIYGQKNISSMSDLKGKTIGYGGKGTLTDFALQLALTQSGMSKSDLTIETFSAQPSQFAALISGSIAAGVFPPPFSVRAQQQGFKLLFSPADVKQASTALALATSRTYLQKHPDVVKAVVAAYVKGVTRAESDPAFAIKSLQTNLGVTAPVATQTYNAFKDLLTNPPLETLSSMQSALTFVKGENPAMSSPNLSQTFDNTFVNQVLKSGG